MLCVLRWFSAHHVCKEQLFASLTSLITKYLNVRLCDSLFHLAMLRKYCYFQKRCINACLPVCWGFCTELLFKCDLAQLSYCLPCVSFAYSVNLLYLVSAPLESVTMSCMKCFSISFSLGAERRQHHCWVCLCIAQTVCVKSPTLLALSISGLSWSNTGTVFV